jgi:hypothetical protein
VIGQSFGTGHGLIARLLPPSRGARAADRLLPPGRGFCVAVELCARGPGVEQGEPPSVSLGQAACTAPGAFAAFGCSVAPAPQ